MARIVGGSMIGELSGKLGGTVFARNKSGQYVRQYVVPVDPKSQAQINARSSFAFASSSYHSMVDAQKANWDNFARTIYLPKNGTNTGQFSGFNAFTALATVAANAQFKDLNVQYADPVTGTPFTGQVVAEFAPSLVAPNSQIQANILTQSGTPAPMSINSATAMDKNGRVRVTINWNLGSGTGTTPVNLPLTDGAGNKIGFSVYVSNPVQQPHMFISNPEQYQIGTVGPLESVTLPLSLDMGVSFDLEIPNLAIYKSFPQAGQYVRISVYAVTESGQMIRIGAVTNPVVLSL